MESEPFLGIPIDPYTLDEAVRACLEVLDRPGAASRTFVHINPHSLVVARRDRLFREALVSSDMRFPDGIGLVIAARLRGTPLPGRVPGPDFLTALSDAIDRRGGARYFFYGSTDQVLDGIRTKVAASWPSITIAGTLSPPFSAMSPAEEAEHVRRINEARPDILWVGMTAPKQEKWVNSHRNELKVPLIGSVGAAFDYLAGTKRRSPPWLRRIGMEWLPRLIREPRRLWRRTVISSPVFLWYSLRESLSRRTRARR
jgi:N-acetylglucosaminyldiphosphoundecaprenol N-acetyl-beta-D-mannosaminyltransferase